MLPREVFRGPDLESERPYLVLAEASEEGGVFEGRSNIRRFGGFMLLAVAKDVAEKLKSRQTSKGEKEKLLDDQFKPAEYQGRGNKRDFDGLYEPLDENGVNILREEDIPDDVRTLELNTHKPSRLIKEFGSPRIHPDQPASRRRFRFWN